MKKLAIFAVALFLIAGVVYAKDYEVTKKAGDFNVVIKIDKNPPIAGDNNLEIAIADASGKAVTEAKVALNYSMPAMAGMPAMSYKVNAELKGSVYKAKVNYSMAGSWSNELKITSAEKTVTARFTIDAK
jgi:hypothetical protein